MSGRTGGKYDAAHGGEFVLGTVHAERERQRKEQTNGKRLIKTRQSLSEQYRQLYKISIDQ